MALYISRHANLTLPIRSTTPTYHPVTGAVIAVAPAISVKFQHAGTVPAYAHDAVSKMADWGTGVGLDEDPFERCGVCDLDQMAINENWSAEDKELVEKILDGGSGSLYVRADPPRAGKPWPNYDQIVGEEEDVAFTISRKVVEDGYDPNAVAAYEAQNANRALVLEALGAIQSELDEDVVGVIQA